MKTELTIRSSLEHDGDGVVRYHLLADSRDFRGAVFAWGSESEVATLAKLLVGFPKSRSDFVEYSFG